MNIQLLIIDPQVDFCEGGALPVPGALADMERLSTFIDNYGDRLDDIHCTLDSHRTKHIAHPSFWKDSSGKYPNPFTIIEYDDVVSGKWQVTNPAFAAWALQYTQLLQKNNRYKLCIWPPHCLIGSVGATITPKLEKSLIDWTEKYWATLNFWTKGSNIKTEHYSVVKADVLDPSDDINTGLNTELIEALLKADKILIAGEALSHCVANTVTDIADAFGDDSYMRKLVLLEDCTSGIPGFETQVQTFLTNMKSRGMEISKSTEYFK